LNTAYGELATVAGGVNNQAGGGSSAVGGGAGNSAPGLYSVVGGGQTNTAGASGSSARNATVAGGRSNLATGAFSAVGGGYANLAQGGYSLAAGRQARANKLGQLVWADSQAFNFPAASDPLVVPANNQFLARATGGAIIVTAVDGAGKATAGVKLAAG